jgi:hypothetical protein
MDVSHQEHGTERFFFIGNLDAGGKDSGYFPVAFGITVYPQLNGPMLIWTINLPVPIDTPTCTIKPGAITGPIFKHSVVIAYTLVMFTLITIFERRGRFWVDANPAIVYQYFYMTHFCDSDRNPTLL